MDTIEEFAERLATALNDGTGRSIAGDKARIIEEAMKSPCFVQLVEGENNIEIQSLFGGKTRKGLVSLRIDTRMVMFDPETAIKKANDLIEAATSAMTDQFLVEFGSSEKFGGQEEVGFAMLAAFREWRQEREGKRKKE